MKDILNSEITFDRFVRGGLWVAAIAAVLWLLNSLSNVLLPFFVAWFLAYMLYPMVCFFQHKVHLHYRSLAIAATLLTVLAVLALVVLLAVPPTLAEVLKLKGAALDYLQQVDIGGRVVPAVRRFLHDHLEEGSLMAFVQQGGIMETCRVVFTQLWTLLLGTFNLVAGLFSAFVCVLYIIFILYDYEKMAEGWIHIFPPSMRPLCLGIAHDVKQGMNAYFRGQAMVALCVGVLFATGFLIIDFPMAIGLGLFIGLLNLVPYLQLIGIVPTVLLALIKSAETGDNFWGIILCAALVFCVVQAIQDLFLVPRIMGKAMGLNPAVILLSLSVWGYILGFIGLIIALPLTTILISYYRRIMAHYEN